MATTCMKIQRVTANTTIQFRQGQNSLLFSLHVWQTNGHNCTLNFPCINRPRINSIEFLNIVSKLGSKPEKGGKAKFRIENAKIFRAYNFLVFLKNLFPLLMPKVVD